MNRVDTKFHRSTVVEPKFSNLLVELAWMREKHLYGRKRKWMDRNAIFRFAIEVDSIGVWGSRMGNKDRGRPLKNTTNTHAASHSIHTTATAVHQCVVKVRFYILLTEHSLFRHASISSEKETFFSTKWKPELFWSWLGPRESFDATLSPRLKPKRPMLI